MKRSAQRGTSFAAMTSSHSNLFHNFPRKRLKSLEAQFCRNALNFLSNLQQKPTDILTSSQRRRRQCRRRCRQRRFCVDTQMYVVPKFDLNPPRQHSS